MEGDSYGFSVSDSGFGNVIPDTSSSEDTYSSGCNTRLVMAIAGLKGIEEGYELPPPVEKDIFAMSNDKLALRGIDSLPGSFCEALEKMRSSELIREILGDPIHEKLCENKAAE